MKRRAKFGIRQLLYYLCLWLLSGINSANAAGADPQAAETAIKSEAFSSFIVQRIYQKLLNRDVKTDEAAPLVAQMKNGDEGWLKVVTSVAASPAYFAQSGNANPQFVTRLFADLVGRAPDTEEELPASIDFLQDNSRAQLAEVLTDTDEFRANFAGIFYQALLNRAPNATEANSAADQLKQEGLGAVVSALLSSAEYYQKSGGSPESWQNAINRDLNVNTGYNSDNNSRPVSPPLSATLPVNGTRGPLVQALLSSPEYQAGVVQSFYQKFLRRAATPAEVQQGLAALQDGTADSVLLIILTSDEYFNRAGGTTNAFLSRLSQDLIAKSGGKRGRPSAQDLLDLLRDKSRSQK